MKKGNNKSTVKRNTIKSDLRKRYETEFLTDVLHREDFKEPDRPLMVYTRVINICNSHPNNLRLVYRLITDIMEAEGLSKDQELFIMEAIYLFFRRSGSGTEMEAIKNLLSRWTNKLKSEVSSNKPRVGDLREGLKEMVKRELAQLQVTLGDLEPIQRINIILRLIPYVLPRVEMVHSEKGE